MKQNCLEYFFFDLLSYNITSVLCTFAVHSTFVQHFTYKERQNDNCITLAQIIFNLIFLRKHVQIKYLGYAWYICFTFISKLTKHLPFYCGVGTHRIIQSWIKCLKDVKSRCHELSQQLNRKHNLNLKVWCGVNSNAKLLDFRQNH